MHCLLFDRKHQQDSQHFYPWLSPSAAGPQVLTAATAASPHLLAHLQAVFLLIFPPWYFDRACCFPLLSNTFDLMSKRLYPLCLHAQQRGSSRPFLAIDEVRPQAKARPRVWESCCLSLAQWAQSNPFLRS